jgi:hypothetical protein
VFCRVQIPPMEALGEGLDSKRVTSSPAEMIWQAAEVPVMPVPIIAMRFLGRGGEAAVLWFFLFNGSSDWAGMLVLRMFGLTDCRWWFLADSGTWRLDRTDLCDVEPEVWMKWECVSSPCRVGLENETGKEKY